MTTHVTMYLTADQRADCVTWLAVRDYQPYPRDRDGRPAEREWFDQYVAVTCGDQVVHVLLLGDRLTAATLERYGRAFADGTLPRVAVDLKPFKVTRAALADWKRAKKDAGVGKQDRYVYEGQMRLGEDE